MSDEQLFSRAFPADKDEQGVSKLGFYAKGILEALIAHHGRVEDHFHDLAVSEAEKFMNALAKRQAKGVTDAGST